MITGIIYGCLNFYNQSQLVTPINELDTKKQSLTAEVDGLTRQLEDLKSRVAVQSSVIGTIRSTRAKNIAYFKLMKDLQSKTPGRVWLQEIIMDSALSVEGKALTNQAILQFAKSFDSSPYLNSVFIRTIKENFIGATTVFDFKLNGQVFLSPSLLEESPGENQQEGGTQ
jgi:Tfp pilus assembly protein PilN